ncbi:hypothetical protein ANCCAN_15399 [Ancylostoma caninum]|uniref:Uncharacterized protein n=1 Tax=Ancylostoma caninum TaxID=29170 RepID=A0A368G2K2_ANCCA|nr:hypothetical protein ANCCAN_15399 [Ancylostoma caninum]
MGGHRRDQSDSHVPLRPSADFGIEGTELQVRLDTSQHSLASPTCNGISINIDPADPEPTCISPKLMKAVSTSSRQ